MAAVYMVFNPVDNSVDKNLSEKQLNSGEARGSCVLLQCNQKINFMSFLTTKLRLFDYEGLPPSLSESDGFSINLTFPTDAFEVTHTRPCLFDCGDFTPHYSFWHNIIELDIIKVEHNDTWDDIGRAYYESRDYQYSEFHCTLCSVDEMKQQIEAWVRQYEQNRITSDLYLIAEPICPSVWERYSVQRHWNEDFHAWIEDFQANYIVERKLWTTDEHHSCRPYIELLIYQHQLAKLSLSGTHPQARKAARPCCRSFLMVSCRQSSGDDLLGH